MKVAEAIRIASSGRLVSRRDTRRHRQFKHGTKPGRVTVAGKPSDDLAPGTLNSIFKQAQIKRGS